MYIEPSRIVKKAKTWINDHGAINESRTDGKWNKSRTIDSQTTKQKGTFGRYTAVPSCRMMYEPL